MNETEVIDNLKVDIFNQIETYLAELGEFSPFGIKSINGQNKNVNYYDDSEVIDGNNALNILKESLKEDIKSSKELVVASIAVNINVEIEEQKTNAVMILISSNGEIWEDEYFPYFLENKTLNWGLRPTDPNL